jgi:hypothetical protein
LHVPALYAFDQLLIGFVTHDAPILEAWGEQRTTQPVPVLGVIVLAQGQPLTALTVTGGTEGV